MKFGKLEVVGHEGPDKQHGNLWRCRCDCGNEKIVSGSVLLSGDTRSCGCLRSKNLLGRKFGRLTVVEHRGLGKQHENRWLCRCECGKETIVVGKSLISGNTRSCGCLYKTMTNRKGKTKAWKKEMATAP
jgi:hypothetical protein